MSEFFTSQTAVDRETIFKTLAAVSSPRMRFLEIGVFFGSTALGVKHWCDERGMKLDYFGCDDFSHPNFKGQSIMEKVSGNWPFPGASIAVGESWDLFYLFPDEMDIVLVDGNHSGNAVILDTALYATKVRKGGFMMFHDTAPHVGQTMPEQHAINHPWWYNSVNEAHKLIGWPWKGWELWHEAFDPKENYGGYKVFRKL